MRRMFAVLSLTAVLVGAAPAIVSAQPATMAHPMKNCALC